MTWPSSCFHIPTDSQLLDYLTKVQTFKKSGMDPESIETRAFVENSILYYTLTVLEFSRPEFEK